MFMWTSEDLLLVICLEAVLCNNSVDPKKEPLQGPFNVETKQNILKLHICSKQQVNVITHI